MEIGQESISKPAPVLTACSLSFLQQVEKESQEEVSRCYQCEKCATGCPMVGEMDLSPNKLFRLIQLGAEERVLSSKAIWYCLSCYACSVRCPNDIDIAKVMDALREMSLKRGYRSSLPEVLNFHQVFLNNVKRHGRVNELGLILRYNLSRGEPFGNLALGWAMLLKGRLSIKPHRIKGLGKLRRLFTPMERGGERS